MSSTAGKHPLSAEKKPLWLLGFVMSLMVGLLFYMAASLSIENDASELFNNLARNTQKNITSRLKSYANLLRGTASLFHANEHVSREQFHRYVANLALQQNYPGVMNLNYSQELDESQRAAFEAGMRRDYPPGRDGYPAFAIHPPGPRPHYSVLVYIEPIPGGSAIPACPCRWKAGRS